MPDTKTPANSPTSLPISIIVGEPDVSGPLAVYPIFADETHLIYTSFTGAGDKISITELGGGGSVNDLAAHNESSKSVLLYEGEELIGARQNRVLDISILVAPGSKVSIPVTCVEHGRWESARHHEPFKPSPQAADPQLRRNKARQGRRNREITGQARSDQTAVWSEVKARSVEHEASSPTAAMSDIYEQRRDRLAELREAVTLKPNQVGSIAAVGGQIAVLDYVGRADVYADLHPALLEGYALDALRFADQESVPEPPAIQTVRGFALLASDTCPGEPGQGPGLGSSFHFAANGVAGSALVFEGEVVALTAFPADGGDDAQPNRRRARVARPTRRRQS